MEVVHRGTHVQIHGNHFSRTARIDMLQTLQRACQRVGVRIHYGQRIGDVSALAAGARPADRGRRRQQRRAHAVAEHFQPSFEKRRNKFAWYGTRQRFHTVSLIFQDTPHGVFIAHSYQYSPELSTFLVEVDPDTQHAQGWTTASEDESRRFCTGVFAESLGGSRIAEQPLALV